MRKKILAVGSALLLVAGLISLGAGPATAGGAGTNDETTWQTLPNETCIKIEPVTVVPYLLPALKAGQSYSKVIVKAGSTGNSVTNENTIYVVSGAEQYPGQIVGPLAPGTPVKHAEKDSISHIILCTVPTPLTVVTSVPAVTFVDECAVGQDSVSVPNQTGVVYTTTDSRTAARVGTVTVTAAPASGYKFADSVTTTQWSHDFTNTDCGSNSTVLTSVPAVTFVDECAVVHDSLTVPTQTGVVYTTVDNRVAGVGSVTVTAAPATGYTFANSVTTTQWSHNFTNTDCGSDPIVVTSVPDVTFVDECAVGQDSVSVPTQAGVVYTTTDGRTAAGVGTVTVAAAPAPGYTFAGSVTTTQWSHDFTNTDCGNNLIVVTSVPDVTFVDECAVDQDSVSVPTQAGVVYTTTDGRTAAGVGTVTVAAAPAPGYTFAGSVTTTQWTYDFTDNICELGTFGLVTPVVTSTNISCAAGGSYTLGEANGVNDAIIWTVDGTVVQPGTVSVRGAGTVHVTAVPNGIEHGFEDGIDNPSTWTLHFTAAQACGDLTTLALPGDNTLAATGADSATVNFGLLFAGGLLLLGGALLIADRKFRYGK